MGQSRAAVINGNAAIAGAQQKRAPRFNVVRIFDGPFEIFRDQRNGFQGIEVIAVSAVLVGGRFYGVDQGIEPGCGCYVGWYAHGEFGIENGHMGFQFIAPAPGLQLVGICENRNPGDFRAGASRSGHGNDGQDVFGQRRFTQLVALGGKPGGSAGGHEFCRIKGGAAAQADNDLGLHRPGNAGGNIYLGGFWFALQAVKNLGFQYGGFQAFQRPPGNTQLREHGISHDKDGRTLPG